MENNSYKEVVYKNTMAQVKKWMEGSGFNMVCEAFGPHEGYLAEVLTDDGAYTLKVRGGRTREKLFIQAVAHTRVREEDRPRVNDMLALEGDNRVEGRVSINGDGSLVAHVSLALEPFARMLEGLTDLAGETGAPPEMVEGLDRLCVPDAAFFEDQGDLAMALVMEAQEKVDKLLGRR